MGAGTVGYELILFVHVLAAIVLIGAGILAAPVIHAAIRSAPSASEIQRWLGIGRPLARISPLSSITLLVTGAILASLGDWWREGWLVVALALWVISAAVATVMNRAIGRVTRLAAESEGGMGPELEGARRAPGMTLVPDVLLASDLAVLFLMVVKPGGLAAPIVVAVVAVAGAVAARKLLSALRLPSGTTRPAVG